jgi:hypothetical protein
LPDALVQKDGGEVWLQEVLSAPTFHLLLCGPARWDAKRIADLGTRYEPLLTVTRLVSASDPGRARHADHLVDGSGIALARLGVGDSAQLLVRPDGHLCYGSDEASVDEVDRYLARWLPGHGPRRAGRPPVVSDLPP